MYVDNDLSKHIILKRKKPMIVLKENGEYIEKEITFSEAHHYSSNAKVKEKSTTQSKGDINSFKNNKEAKIPDLQYNNELDLIYPQEFKELT